MGSAVAPTLREIDPGWLDEALRTARRTEAKVVAVEVEPLAFTGATTDMARVRVSYDDSGAPGPATMVAKIRGHDEVQRQMDAVMGLFERECRFYSELAERVPVRTPDALHVGDGDATPLLLEDLGALRLGDQNEGLSVADAEAALDALADMHAAFWESDLLAEPWLARPTTPPISELISQIVGTGAPVLAERFSGQVDDRVLAQVADAAPRWAQILEKIGAGPHTLVHNDCRLDNMFFADDGTPVFVDWQLVSDMRASQDVGNLLAGSMTADDLSANWQALLRRYHARLVANGVDGYGYDDCELHYRQGIAWALGQGMALLGALGEGSERGVGVGDAIVTRALSHMVELDTFAALDEG